MAWEYEIWVDGQFVDAGPDLAALERPPGARCVLEASEAHGEEVEAALEAARQHGVQGLLLSDARDAHAAALSRIGSLESLDLTHSPVTDAILPALSDLPRLRSLALRSTGVTGTGLEALLGLGALRSLDLTQCALVPEAVHALSRLGVLRELWLDRTGLQGGHLAPLSRLGSLERLGLAGTSFAPGDLAFLERMTALRHLDLQGEVGITDADLAPLRALQKLESLSLAGRADILGPGLRFLEGLARLEELDLSETLITGAYLAHLAGLPLVRLLLRETPLLCDEEALDEDDLADGGAPEGEAPSCTERAAADLGGLAALARCATLRHLDLAGATITDEAMEPLSRLPALEVLVLDHTPVAAEALEVFAGHGTLQTVRFRGRRLTLQQAVTHARSATGGDSAGRRPPGASGNVPQGAPDPSEEEERPPGGGLAGLLAALGGAEAEAGAAAGADALLAALADDADADLPEDVRAAIDADAGEVTLLPPGEIRDGNETAADPMGDRGGLELGGAAGGLSAAEAEEASVRDLLDKLVEAGKIELVAGASLDDLPPGLGAILARRGPALKKAEAFTEWLLEQEDVIEEVYYADEELARVLEVW